MYPLRQSDFVLLDIDEIFGKIIILLKNDNASATGSYPGVLATCLLVNWMMRVNSVTISPCPIMAF